MWHTNCTCLIKLSCRHLIDNNNIYTTKKEKSNITISILKHITITTIDNPNNRKENQKNDSAIPENKLSTLQQR